MRSLTNLALLRVNARNVLITGRGPPHRADDVAEVDVLDVRRAAGDAWPRVARSLSGRQAALVSSGMIHIKESGLREKSN